MMITTIRNLKIEDIVNGPNIQRLLDTYDLIQDAQDIIAKAKANNIDVDPIRIGTAVVHEFFEKIASGKLPVDFTADDWKDIINDSAGIAILADEQQYSKYVFRLYIEYIDLSIQYLSGGMSEEKVDAVHELKGELIEKTNQLDAGGIDEVSYIEDCLWICLEAMIKFISARIESIAGEKLGPVIDAAATFAFEYARLTLLRKEQALLAEYLENQKMLDVELRIKFDRYVEELETKSLAFDGLIANAFDPDMRNMLHNSELLARVAGVDEKEILKTEEDVDDFFLG